MTTPNFKNNAHYQQILFFASVRTLNALTEANMTCFLLNFYPCHWNSAKIDQIMKLNVIQHLFFLKMDSQFWLTDSSTNICFHFQRTLSNKHLFPLTFNFQRTLSIHLLARSITFTHNSITTVRTKINFTIKYITHQTSTE